MAICSETNSYYTIYLRTINSRIFAKSAPSRLNLQICLILGNYGGEHQTEVYSVCIHDCSLSGLCYSWQSLLRTYSILNLQSAPCISYSSTTKTITVSCTTPTRLTDVNNAVHNSNILKKESPGVWLLSVKVVVAKNGNFAIDSTDTSWLKIASSSTAAYGLINYGSLKIDSVKITSWNVGTNTYASTSSDGKTPRAYIVAKSGATGKMNILNSEIAYLGRDVTGEHGLDYYGSHGSLIQGNNIHHNWRAFYSAGVGGLTFTKNMVHDNLQYGLIRTLEHTIWSLPTTRPTIIIMG